MQRDESTLLDIAKAANQIMEFQRGIPKEVFVADAKTQSAILYQLLIIGEAVKRLSRKFRNQHNGVPWLLIAGMRDHLIHAYDTVDWDEVWKTATADVPALLAQIEPILPRESDM